MNIIKTNLVFGALTKRTKTTKAVWHNSGVTVLQSVETIHNYLKNTNGWAGIGYHFYIRKDGLIYEGRPLDTVGAHAYGSNSDSIGMCFEGNFDKEQMTPEQVESGKWLASYIRSIYPDIKFCGHRDLCKTSCPGANFKFDEIVNGQAPVNPVVPVNDKAEVIRSLQHAYNVSYNAGLAEDGIKGPLTEKAMRNYPIRNYKANELARWVQDRLVNHKGYSLVIDGKYGKDTERVVKQFQRDNNKVVDGIAGYETINILI